MVRSLILACCLGICGCIVPVDETPDASIPDAARPRDEASTVGCAGDAMPAPGDPCDPFELGSGKVCRVGSCLIGCTTTCTCTNESRWSCAKECREYANPAFRYECGVAPACDSFCRAYPVADAGT